MYQPSTEPCETPLHNVASTLCFAPTSAEMVY